METLKIFLLFLLVSCGNRSIKDPIVFKRILPDTSNSWSGRMTQNDYYLTRKLEDKFHLQTLINGVKKQELRIWDLHGYYDPQNLIILSNKNSNSWSLRTISFYGSANDSISADNIKEIHSTSIDSLNLNRYWNLPSQSDMKLGDSDGCADGNNYFVEIADSIKYRFMWYRCPDKNKNKDSVFMIISDLPNKLTSLSLKN